MKRLTSLFLAAVMAITGILFPQLDSYAATTFEEAVLAALQNRNQTLSARNYAKACYSIDDVKAENNRLMEEALEIICNYPEMYYVAKKISGQTRYTTSSNSGVLKSFTITLKFTYTMSQTEFNKSKPKFDAAASRALAAVLPNMSDFEKALALHDYIVLNSEYDKEAADKNITTRAHTSYDCLVNKIAVCEGYALAYVYLLRKVGVDAYVISSKEMNHAWAYVKIDGKWYHVDPTWDDPTVGGQYNWHGKVEHDNFLRSDKGITETKHYGWDIPKKANGATANSTRFDSGFWTGISSGMFKVGDEWFYTKQGAMGEKKYDFTSDLRAYNIVTKKFRTLLSIGPNAWGYTERREGNTTYSNWMQGSFTFDALYNGKVYYNTTDEIRAFSLSTGKDELVYTYKGDGDITGVTAADGTLVFSVKTDLNGDDKLYKKSIEASTSVSIKLNVTMLKIAKGKSSTLKATLDPASSKDFVYWCSSDSAICSVDYNGKVTGVKAGKCTITAYTDSGAKATVTVTVA
ncbi:MAG: Ig-like domain-containing protein [Oscillospiraceae bacterium]|jgi:hypothetical protein|nr:Ig-like domain-containing protein [Oscillospiraceae bacterium]